MTYTEKGCIVSFNKTGDTCGGGLSVFECETAKELMQRSATVDLSYASESIADGWVGNGNTNTSCGQCMKSCGVSVHAVYGRPTEELCFTFS